MKKQSEEDLPPSPSDLAGWRTVIVAHRLASFRPEAIVAALQELDPHSAQSVRNALAQHLSNALIKMLRGYIGRNHPNEGEDMIIRVHGEIFEALLEKGSADGKGLREAFAPRVQFRAKDAIATEYRHSRIPLMPRVREVQENEDADDVETDPVKVADVSRLVRRGGLVAPTEDASGSSGDEVVPNSQKRDPILLSGAHHADEHIDVECVLANIKDFRKRLAFRLFMEDVPLKSIRSDSIAKTLGISDKTARAWIEEARQLLEGTAEVKELQGRNVGERT
jgi:hypothetical protein